MENIFYVGSEVKGLKHFGVSDHLGTSVDCLLVLMESQLLLVDSGTKQSLLTISVPLGAKVIDCGVIPEIASLLIDL